MSSSFLLNTTRKVGLVPGTITVRSYNVVTLLENNYLNDEISLVGKKQPSTISFVYVCKVFISYICAYLAESQDPWIVKVCQNTTK